MQNPYDFFPDECFESNKKNIIKIFNQCKSSKTFNETIQTKYLVDGTELHEALKKYAGKDDKISEETNAKLSSDKGFIDILKTFFAKVLEKLGIKYLPTKNALDEIIKRSQAQKLHNNTL